MKDRTMNLQELKRNNKKYFANGTKSFFQNKEYHVFTLLDENFLITKTQPWGMDKTIFTIKPIIEYKIETTLGHYDTLQECVAFIEGYLKIKKLSIY